MPVVAVLTSYLGLRVVDFVSDSEQQPSSPHERKAYRCILDRTHVRLRPSLPRNLLSSDELQPGFFHHSVASLRSSICLWLGALSAPSNAQLKVFFLKCAGL